MADPLTDLANLAIERAEIMERLQQIDDAAGELLTSLDVETKATRSTWAHLLPKDPVPKRMIRDNPQA